MIADISPKVIKRKAKLSVFCMVQRLVVPERIVILSESRPMQRPEATIANEIPMFCFRTLT